MYSFTTLFRSGVTALDSAKIRAENSEFARGGGSVGDSGGGTTSIGQTISAGASDLTVKGCYLHHQMHQVRIHCISERQYSTLYRQFTGK